MRFRSRDELTEFELTLGLSQPEYTFDPVHRLTINEEICARLICYGLTNKRIAATLHISELNARNCVGKVMDRLLVDSRHDVILKARRTNVGGTNR